MTSLGLACAISEFQTILSYQKKSVSKKGKKRQNIKKAGQEGAHAVHAFGRKSIPLWPSVTTGTGLDFECVVLNSYR